MKRRTHRLAGWTLAVLVVIGTGAGLLLYWRHAALYPSTADAYIDAHVIHVAAQVSGEVAQVYVHDQRAVRRGAPLFELDKRPFRLAVRQANAALTIAGQNVEAEMGAVKAAAADVREKTVLAANARTNADRKLALVARGFLSPQAGDDAQAALKSAEAQLASSKAKLYEAEKTLGTPGQRNERIEQARAALEQTRLDLEHTDVVAPCAGVVSQLKLRPGDTVDKNVPVFVLVCSQEFWVNANFKETDLQRIRAGQSADVTVDMYPGEHFAGIVESVDAAAGAAFSLLPPQNATGNWVKVTQRVPVRVLLTHPGPAFPLRVGTSATVTIDTTSSARPPKEPD